MAEVRWMIPRLIAERSYECLLKSTSKSLDCIRILLGIRAK